MYVDVRLDPGGRVFPLAGLGVGEARRPERGDEYGRRGDFPGRRIGDVDPDAGVVDEELLAGPVLLAHDHIELPAPRAVEITEARAAVAALGMRFAVFLPEQLKGHPPLLERRVDRLAVRLRSPARLLGRRIQPRLEGGVVKRLGQRPAEPGRLCPRHDVVHGGGAHPAAGRRRSQRAPHAQAQSQNLPCVAHR